MNFVARAGALFSGILCFTACGRYAPPISPELTSPQSVEVVEVAEVSAGSNSAGSNSAGSNRGLAIKWLAPDRDVRGEPLKELWGYQVYRLSGAISARGGGSVGLTMGEGSSLSSGLLLNSSGVNSSGVKSSASKAEPVKFEKIGEVADVTIAKLKELRSKAREEGQVERKVKLSREDRLVTFVDRGFKGGTTQSYKIVPLNSSYVMPEVDKIIQVKSGTGEAGSPALSFEMVDNPEFAGTQEEGSAGFEDELMEE